MKQNNFIIGPTDTDSISFCKSDMKEFTEEEFGFLLKEINEISPEFIEWEHDGNYAKCLVLKAKNYILVDKKGKKTIKGSSLRDSKKPKSFSDYMLKMVDIILDEKQEELIPLYNKYVQEIINLKDITPWAKKLTVTGKITNCKGHEKYTAEENKRRGVRTNESKVYDAIKHTDFQEGNKIYVYFKQDKTYGLASEFSGDYDKKALLRSLYSVTQVFENVIDFSKFINYSLVKHYKELTGEAAPVKKSKKKVIKSDVEIGLPPHEETQE